jgi:predicted transcriptional regulator
METIKIGIMNRKDFRQYTLDIVTEKIKPQPNAPKIWFDSIESMAHILSSSNRELLSLIKTHQPQSLTELAQLSGQRKERLSRTLWAMKQHGIIALEKGKKNTLVPHVLVDSFEIAAFS